MGMYTELVMNVGLVDNLDEKIVAVLKKMLTGDGEPDLPDHPLFTNGTRWSFMLNTGSFYFVPEGCSKLVENELGRVVRHLTVRSDFKNYSNEIDLFVDWITPYLDAEDGDFLGYKRYEEDDRPTLLFHPNRWEIV